MRRLVIPKQHYNADSLTNLPLEEVPERCRRSTGQWLGRLPHKLDRVVNGPADHINQMVSLDNGVANVLPTLAMLVDPATIYLNLGQITIGHMGILIESNTATSPEREVGVGHAGVPRAGAHPILVQRVVLNRLVSD